MRYKEFNKNSVLEKCIPLFWDNGFAACAISDIVNITKVNRFSLYEEFQNKEGILHHSLALYQERDANEKLKILDQDYSNLKVLISDFFFSFLNENNPRNLGCFILHTATELADTDEKVRTFLGNYIDTIEEKFIQLLNKFPETKNNPTFYARQLIGLFCTSMSFCLIHSKEERKSYINNGINVILNKQNSYGSNTQ